MQLENWDIDEQIKIEEDTLNLSGAAVRSMLFLKPYVLAFYAQEKYNDYDAVVESSQPKNMQLIINSDMINAGMIVMGFREGLGRTEYGKMQSIQSKFDEMFDIFGDFSIKKGDRVNLHHNKQGELKVYLNNALQFSESDSNVIKAIYGIWFSESFDKKLRNQLLGIS